MVEEDVGVLGTALRAHRTRTSLTQQELAELAGVSVRTVRQIERGHVQQPRTASVRQLAAILGLAAEGEQVAAGSLRVDVLGPLTVHLGQDVVPLASAQQRCVLGLLALHPNQVVTTEDLVDVLWGHRPPATYRQLLHNLVSRLRKVLRTDHVVTTRRAGYLLEIDSGRLDLLRFTELAARAGALGDAENAMEAFGRALGCWRAPVLAGLPERLQSHPTAVAVTQRRLSVALAYADLAIERGAHEQAATELRTLVHHEPLHEGLHARLMLALAGTGDQAGALALFSNLRDRLADELAVVPSDELRAAHLRVVRGEVPGVSRMRRPRHPVPAELPDEVTGFSGRTTDLTRLDTVLSHLFVAEREHSMPLVAAIHGTAGMGKTALAVHWGHRARAHFPDGQLFVNLRGFDAVQAPAEPGQVLGRFLRCLGVEPELIPRDPAERAACFRSTVAGRRMLVVLDNAADTEQVRPLLPGTSSCVVLVTSRKRLDGLAAHDVPVDTLRPSEAMALFENVVGRHRVAAEVTAAAELAQLCGYLPLALRLAASQLLLRPRLTFAEAAIELGMAVR
jgi:DNA-binding SARP family transcriptional activator/DNA-binding XRE family transcriptional regulator